MPDYWLGKGGEFSLPAHGVATALPAKLFASTWLLKTGMQSYSLLVASAWHWLLWLTVTPKDEHEQIDSGKIKFILSKERFPIDLIGSYDVDRAKSIIAKTPRMSEPANVDLWRAYADHMGWQRLDPAEDAQIDCSIPVIIAVVDQAGGEHMLIDGWHRLEKAIAEGHDVIQAFYLTEKETKDVFDVSWKGLPPSLVSA